MARYTDFNPETMPVLRFAPVSYIPFRKHGRRFLLWPAFGYRVLAPRPAQKRLNVFQKAVLGFCRIETKEPDQIAAHLHLDLEVVRFVLGEMRREGWLDFKNSVTSLGRDLLASELDQLPAELVVGHVFQDPWLGQLWPRFIETLEYAQVEFNSQGRLCLDIRKKEGDPRREDLFVKFADTSVVPRTPSPMEVVRVCARHARDLHRNISFDVDPEEPAGESDEDDELDSASAGLRTRIEAVSFISEEPELFFLTTSLYYPKGLVRSADWYLMDPFGLGPSARMRRLVEQQLARDATLSKFLDSFIKDCLGEGDEQDNHWNTATLSATERVTQKLGEWVYAYPFFDLLVAMERSYQEVVSDPGEKTPVDKYDDVLIKSVKALEGLLRFINTRYPDPSAWEIYNLPSYAGRKSIIEQIASSLGYRTPLPGGLSGVKPENLRRSCRSGGGTLNERLLVALLSARHVAEHPLKTVAGEIPDLFERLASLTHLRGQGAHDTGLKIDLKMVEQQVNETYLIVQILTSKIS